MILIWAIQTAAFWLAALILTGLALRLAWAVVCVVCRDTRVAWRVWTGQQKH